MGGGVACGGASDSTRAGRSHLRQALLRGLIAAAGLLYLS